jgi:hypothetical protein
VLDSIEAYNTTAPWIPLDSKLNCKARELKQKR